MMEQRGSSSIAPPTPKSRYQMTVSDQWSDLRPDRFHTRERERQTRYLFNRWVSSPPDTVSISQRKEKLISPAGIRTPYRPTYSPVNISTTLSWLPAFIQSTLSSFRYQYKLRGRAVTQWLRHYATNRQVAGSIPDGVIGIFQ